MLGEKRVKNTCFSVSGMDFQDIQVDTLCSTHGKAVEEKEKSCRGFFPQKGQGIKQDQ